MVVAWALGRGLIPWNALRDLREIQHISSRFKIGKVYHVYREGNRVADALAAWQTKIGSTIFRPSQLSEIWALIGEDKAGRILIRKA
ncbi:hypothetical protein QJS04_geneDACA017709 [Acorus gramineus]|uniref:RNase H type-1 domain-containing protein n=1 Tax=Acorus gramineus TaxID=55184 RepID=A0AAV9BXE5_ACOGR|nr:hypothetical protein QJS04_geneDACA017709 [Acorus gramineus]